jgi:hypothetical protein
MNGKQSLNVSCVIKGIMALTAKQANLNFHVIISVWCFHINVLSIIIPKNFMLVILDFILLILLF